MADRHEKREKATRQLLESLQRAGVTHVPKPGPKSLSIDQASPSQSIEIPSQAQLEAEELEDSAPRLPRPSKRSVSQAPKLFDASDAEPLMTSTASTLEILQGEVAACTLCQELAETRTQTVFGVGDPEARLCFMGEAPGADEDKKGEPFVGRAGQLLNKIIEACGMKREEVYILNVLKCRPPGNRNPSPAESQNCRRYLNRQLELISPEFICCLGAVAAQNLLETATPIGRLRGKVHDYRGIRVVCTYHPAYLLRNPSAKKPTWDDMKMLLGEMGMDVPS